MPQNIWTKNVRLRDVRQCSSMFVQLRQRLSIFINVRQCSSMFVNVRQRSSRSMFVEVHQCTSMFINVRQWSSRFVNVRQCSSMLVNVCQCSSMFVNVCQWQCSFMLRTPNIFPGNFEKKSNQVSMLQMDSIAQINLGLSKRFWIIGLKNVIYKRKMFSHKISEPQMFKKRPPDRILEHFLYRSESFWPVRLFGITHFFREVEIWGL